MVPVFENVTTEYAEIARRPLVPDKCALIVIDIQEKLLAPIFRKEQLVRNAKCLFRPRGVLRIPAIASTQYSKGRATQCPKLLLLLETGDDRSEIGRSDWNECVQRLGDFFH